MDAQRRNAGRAAAREAAGALQGMSAPSLSRLISKMETALDGRHRNANEIGGSIIRCGAGYQVAAAVVGEHHRVPVNAASRIVYHTHPGPTSSLLRDYIRAGRHGNMPSSGDLMLLLCLSTLRVSVVFGPQYTILLQKSHLSELERELGRICSFIEREPQLGISHGATELHWILEWFMGQLGYGLATWVGFLRRAGFSVTVREPAMDLPEIEAQLKADMKLKPGRYHAIQDPAFDTAVRVAGQGIDEQLAYMVTQGTWRTNSVAEPQFN